MDPATTTAIIIGVVGIVGAFIANLRVRSRCHTENLDISIQKQFNQDLNKVLQDKHSTSDSETTI